jgi:hypothetical protein
MGKRDDYIAGAHDYWVHFWCGLMFGAGLAVWGGWFGLGMTGWELVVFTTVFSLVIALSCARWGDRAWHWILERLHWFT